MQVTAIGRALPGAAPIKAAAPVRKVVRAEVPEQEQVAFEALPETGERTPRRRRPGVAPVRSAAQRSTLGVLAALDKLTLGG